jgi:hypothetical protein
MVVRGDQLSGTSLGTPKDSVKGTPRETRVRFARAGGACAMSHRALLSTFAALIGIVGASHSPRADSGLPESIVPAASTPPVVLREARYTVLTMAPDGSWGVATSIFIREAITGAMTDCMLMSGRKLGCGYISKAGRGDWVLGVRCGSENILAASKILANAELAAFNRETELRQDGRNMPPCFRLVTVHPDGLVADTKTRVPTLTLEPTGASRD